MSNGNTTYWLDRPWWKHWWCRLFHFHATAILDGSMDNLRTVILCLTERIIIYDSIGAFVGEEMGD